MSANPKIIYFDEDIIVIDKPAGMPCVSLKEDDKGTLAFWLIEKFPAQKNIEKGKLEAGLVHRLDNETSGIVIAARNDNAYKNLRAQFEAGSIEKEYLAVVIGYPPNSGTINTPIAHHPRKKKKMTVCESKILAKELDARKAITSYKVEERYGLKFALLKVVISTGVRHQIRAHLASINYPLVGDKLYQKAIHKRQDIKDVKRHLLHASKIKFIHPTTGKKMEFESLLPFVIPACFKVVIPE